MRAGAIALARSAWDTSRMSSDDTPVRTPMQAFAAGLRSAAFSVFAAVLFGTYIGIGALAHDFGFGVVWVMLSTLLIWAGPAQVILISSLGAGTAPIEAAVAVGLSGVRLMPMVVSLLPVVRTPRTTFADLMLPTHYTSVSMWVESMRLAPQLPRPERIPFVNGIGTAYCSTAIIATAGGFYLAAKLPALFTAGLLFLTPIAFLVSTARNARALVDRLALVFGLVIGPILAYAAVGLDIMWAGIAGGTLAYLVHRLAGRRA
jgi:predicted branched-subunit amino acid permease